MTAPDLWLCVNVGVDGVDIMAKEMSVVWLIVDFFSSYHRSDVRQESKVVKGIGLVDVYSFRFKCSLLSDSASEARMCPYPLI